jgi:hypothetical protein
MLLRVSDLVLNIVVDVSFAGEEIRGHVSDGVREPKPFSGWLGLIGALDTMIESSGPDTVTPIIQTRSERDSPQA